MPINPFEGFQFDSSADVNHVENKAFQDALQSGNQHQMRAAVFNQAATVMQGGSQSYKKARKSERVLQQALEETGGQNDDSLASRKKYLARAQKLAIEAGLPEIAMQAGDMLTQVTDLEMQRAKLKADTTFTEQATDIAGSQEKRADRAGLRAMEVEELLQQKAQLEATLPSLNDPDARNTVEGRIGRIDAIIGDKRIEFERSKQYDVKEYEVTGPDGEVYTRTILQNRNDPDDQHELGMARTEDINNSSGNRSRVLAKVEQFSIDNLAQGAAADQEYILARRAYQGTHNLGPRGLQSGARKKFLDLMGAEDLAEVNKKFIDQATKVKGLALLPPGSASDKDVEIVLSTVLKDSSSAESLQAVLQSQMRLAAWERKYTTFADQYLRTALAEGREVTTIGLRNAWQAYAGENVEAFDNEIAAQVANDLGLKQAVPERRTAPKGRGGARVTNVTVQGEE
jgi:hypothetical protein